ncbi:SDR family oxidoreductase [Cumulibacter manganitolerans]|uniref:SDR family oxidoreductase n=1 Tax=Cumulibacter manganitolerans TaxID=1884992 RepID=UPI0012959F2E|nr:SDR family oxidoreductase [Cumulibacter manganitolerans]
MDLGIAGKSALVCASTAGLGAATARALAAEGVKVVFSGRRLELAEQQASAYPEGVAIEADISTVEGAMDLLEKAREAVGDIDILVLNGPGPRPGTATTVTGEDLHAAFESLMVVQHALVDVCLPHMRQQGWGRILSIASSGVIAPITNLALSSVGRMALGGYLKALANEISGDGVTVNMLLPGRIATDRMKSLDANTAKSTGKSIEEISAAGVKSIPAGRYGDPDEFGAVGAFLCSEQASYVTGSAIRCDGGAHGTL